MLDTKATRNPAPTVEAERGAMQRSTKRAAVVIAAAVLVACLGAVAQAADVQVVVHPSTSTIEVTKKDVVRVFLRQKSRWPNGERAKPIDQSIKSDVRAAFSEKVLGRSLKEVNNYWNSQVFAGKATPPPTAASDQEVLDFVRSNPGGVGYVSAGSDTTGVKVLKVE